MQTLQENTEEKESRSSGRLTSGNIRIKTAEGKAAK